jgi:hypothetical protein
LLPTTEGPLPPALMRKRFPTLLVERLNYDEANCRTHQRTSSF